MNMSGYGDKMLRSEEEVYDSVNRPKHYNSHPSGIEPILITQHEEFTTGNAIKYIMRSKYKGSEEEDLKKAVYYLNTKLSMLKESAKDELKLNT
jgi:hypothetical protein